MSSTLFKGFFYKKAGKFDVRKVRKYDEESVLSPEEKLVLMFSKAYFTKKNRRKMCWWLPAVFLFNQLTEKKFAPSKPVAKGDLSILLGLLKTCIQLNKEILLN